jgi:hypothetical protein
VHTAGLGSVFQESPLRAALGDEYAHAWLQHQHTAPAKLTEIIVGQADGNPYCMEELVRRLIDHRAIVVDEPRWTVRADRLDRVRLRGTLVALLLAWLDALPAGCRMECSRLAVRCHGRVPEACAGTLKPRPSYSAANAASQAASRQSRPTSNERLSTSMNPSSAATQESFIATGAR